MRSINKYVASVPYGNYKPSFTKGAKSILFLSLSSLLFSFFLYEGAHSSGGGSGCIAFD